MINSPFVPETSLWASQQIIVVVDNNGLFGGTPFRPVKMTHRSLEDIHDLRLQASQSEGHHCAEAILRARDPEIRHRAWSMRLAHKPFGIQQTEKSSTSS
jgi:hypothetical protein